MSLQLRNPYAIHDADDQPSSTPASREDKAIQGTNDDAGLSRLSAIRAGYILDDHYTDCLVRVRVPVKRSPLINRGSYVRYTCITRLMVEFLRGVAGKCQVLSIGAGSDARFFTLRDMGFDDTACTYFEVDFDAVTRQKIDSIRNSRKLSAHLSDMGLSRCFTCLYVRLIREVVDSDVGGLHSSSYHLISGDLRMWKMDVVDKLTRHGFDLLLPTFVLCECVLVYLEPQVSDTIIDWCASSFETCVMVAYDPMEPNDSFGKVMISNLKSRNIVLKSIYKYPDVVAQRQRYLSAGFESCQVADMISIYDKNTSEEEKARVSALEMLDEVEEWTILGK
eukprot:Partr_v1_DN27774_c2_g1_i7_m67732 putative leucine carboxyl methyltransferase